MFDIVERALKAVPRHGLCQQFGNALALATISDLLKHQREIRPMDEEIADLPQQIGPDVLIDRDMLDIGQRETRFPQAIGDGLRWKASPMLDPGEPFLFRRCHKLAITNNRRCRIAVEGIQAEYDHPITCWA